MVAAKPRRARCPVLESMSIEEIRTKLPHLHQVVVEQKRIQVNLPESEKSGEVAHV